METFLYPHTGASGVGRSHIKNALLSQNPEKFVYPAPCKYFSDALEGNIRPKGQADMPC